MKIKINSDVFDIVKRIKEVDDGYYIVFDTTKNKYELHNRKQQSTYCLTCPFENLDKRLLDFIHKTNSRHIDKIVEEIDNNNKKVERNIYNNAKDTSDFMLREIYAFSNNSSKNLDDVKAFTSVWR